MALSLRQSSTGGESVQGFSIPLAASALERPLDVSFTIDELTSSTNDFSRYVDDSRIGIYGVSFGAYTSIVSHAGDTKLGLSGDPRLKAIFPTSTSRGEWIDPDFRINYQSTVPTFLLTGTRDGGVPRHHSELYRRFTRDSVENTVYSAVIDDAVHSSYGDACGRRDFAAENEAPETVLKLYNDLVDVFGNCRDGVIDNSEAIDLTAHFATAFFQTHLNGDLEFAQYLTPEYVEGNLPATIQATVVPEPNGFVPFALGLCFVLFSLRRRSNSRRPLTTT